MFKDKTAFLEALQHLPPPDPGHGNRARSRQKLLTKPEGSLGRLEDIACWLAAWQHSDMPSADHVTVSIFAGNHGITAQNISPYPPEVTQQMVRNFQSGGGAINQICKTFGLGLHIRPIRLDTPTGDVTLENAMSEGECLEAINIGAGCVKAKDNIVVPGEMGIGNTTIAAILCAILFRGTGQDWAGAGTGQDNRGVRHKASVIDCAIARHDQKPGDPFSLLCHTGGREIAAICGLVLAARRKSVPVILDGFIVGAAAAVLQSGNRAALDHCVAGHVSAEQAHKRLLQETGLFPPLLDLGMRLGEATGAALAVQVLRGAVSIHNGMASFAEADVSNLPGTPDQ